MVSCWRTCYSCGDCSSGVWVLELKLWVELGCVELGCVELSWVELKQVSWNCQRRGLFSAKPAFVIILLDVGILFPSTVVFMQCSDTVPPSFQHLVKKKWTNLSFVLIILIYHVQNKLSDVPISENYEHNNFQINNDLTWRNSSCIRVENVKKGM